MNVTTHTEKQTLSRSDSKILEGARILVVSDNDSDTQRLRTLMTEAGFASDCAKSITKACEAARSGEFQVIVSTPHLRDGSWRRLADIANHYDLGFEIVLWAHNLDRQESAEALDNGASDVVDPADVQPRAVGAIKRALWAAYLKGAGPYTRPNPRRPAVGDHYAQRSPGSANEFLLNKQMR